LRGAHAHFSWPGHVERYLKAVRRLQRRRDRRPVALAGPNRLLLARGLLLCDIDHTLLGDVESLAELLRWLEEHRAETVFGIATGRVLESAVKVLDEWGVPMPDVLVTAVGSEIHYGAARPVEDIGWRRAIDHRWEPERIRQVLDGVPGLRLQPRVDQRRFKLSYFIDPDRAPSVAEIRKRLRRHELTARVIFSHDAFLDLLPRRASKGGALRYLANRWGLPLDRVVTAGDSGNDAEMLTAGAWGVVVGNHSQELLPLRGQDRVYFAEAEFAAGVLEGIRHYGFPAGDREGRSEQGAR
jgi:sucrose-phosphate synthase